MLISPYADEVAQVIAEEGVKAVTTGAGNPEKYMEMWKKAGDSRDPGSCLCGTGKTNGAVSGQMQW